MFSSPFWGFRDDIDILNILVKTVRWIIILMFAEPATSTKPKATAESSQAQEGSSNDGNMFKKVGCLVLVNLLIFLMSSVV